MRRPERARRILSAAARVALLDGERVTWAALLAAVEAELPRADLAHPRAVAADLANACFALALEPTWRGDPDADVDEAALRGKVDSWRRTVATLDLARSTQRGDDPWDLLGQMQRGHLTARWRAVLDAAAAAVDSWRFQRRPLAVLRDAIAPACRAARIDPDAALQRVFSTFALTVTRRRGCTDVGPTNATAHARDQYLRDVRRLEARQREAREALARRGGGAALRRGAERHNPTDLRPRRRGEHVGDAGGRGDAPTLDPRAEAALAAVALLLGDAEDG